MLDHIDLTQKLSKARWKETRDELELRLGALQRQAREAKIPVLVVVEGWDGAGKGELINSLIIPMDPRGFKVESTRVVSPDVRRYPPLWRFWQATPVRGRMVIFDRSWYHRVIDDRVEHGLKGDELELAFRDIQTFERQLAVDGTVIIKLFLHIDADEQEKRFSKLLEKDNTAWRVSEHDRQRQRERAQYEQAIDDTLTRTHTPAAPWIVIPAHDKRLATSLIITAVSDALQKGLESLNATQVVPVLPPVTLVNPDKRPIRLPLEREDYKIRHERNSKELFELALRVWQARIPVCMVFEGCDAAGKGGNIKRLALTLDPRGYEVVPIAAPNDVELAHHYLWRFWTRLPKSGHFTIFDRSWYGRVLVERVEGFATEAEWKRAYGEINEFEEQLVAEGTVLLKFWLHIDQDEQLARFTARQEDEHKQWKITDDDWRNRKKWPQYRDAIAEMLQRTNVVPWHFISTNSKYRARIDTQDIVIRALKERLREVESGNKHKDKDKDKSDTKNAAVTPPTVTPVVPPSADESDKKGKSKSSKHKSKGKSKDKDKDKARDKGGHTETNKADAQKSVGAPGDAVTGIPMNGLASLEGSSTPGATRPKPARTAKTSKTSKGVKATKSAKDAPA